MKKIQLTQKLIVSAISPSEPVEAGAVFVVEDRADEIEADALIQIGYARELTGDDAGTAVTVLTRAQIKAGKTLEPAADPAPVIDNERGKDDNALLVMLDGSIPEVEARVDAEFESLTGADIQRLIELEKAGKDRDGVAKYLSGLIEE